VPQQTGSCPACAAFCTATASMGFWLAAAAAVANQALPAWILAPVYTCLAMQRAVA
jgi:hypothetical protein